MGKVHHIGWIVKNIENSKRILEFLMGSETETGDTVADNDRLINISFMKSQGLCYELIEPVSHDSPVMEILKREGPIMYHICFEVEDIDHYIEILIGKGMLLLYPKKPAVAISNRNVAFLYEKSIGLIELLETE